MFEFENSYIDSKFLFVNSPENFLSYKELLENEKIELIYIQEINPLTNKNDTSRCDAFKFSSGYNTFQFKIVDEKFDINFEIVDLLDNNSFYIAYFKSIITDNYYEAIISSIKKNFNYLHDSFKILNGLFNFKVLEIKLGNNTSNQFLKKYDLAFKIETRYFSKNWFLKKVNDVKKIITLSSICACKKNDRIRENMVIFKVINLVYTRVYLPTKYSKISYEELSSIDFYEKNNQKIFLNYKAKLGKPLVYPIYYIYDIETIPSNDELKHYLHTLSCVGPIIKLPNFCDLIENLEPKYCYDYFKDSNLLNTFSYVEELIDKELDKTILFDIQKKVAQDFSKYLIESALNILEENKLILDPYRVTYYNVFEVRIVGYNSHSFDNQFVVDSLKEELRYYHRTVSKRDLKIIEHTIKSKLLDIPIKFIDLIQWLPEMSSLKQACDSFDLIESKLDFNIVKFNELTIKDKVFQPKLNYHDFFKLIINLPNSFYFSLKKHKPNNKVTEKNILNEFNKNSKILKLTSLNDIDVLNFMKIYCEYDSVSTALLTLTLIDLFSECIKKVVDKAELKEFTYINSNIGSVNLDSEYEDENENFLYKRKELSFNIKEEGFGYLDMFSYLTPSQIAFSLYKCIFSENLRVNDDYDPYINKVVEDAFFGGLVIIGGIGHSVGHIIGRDVRSQYPTCMTGPMPLILKNKYTYMKNLSNSHISNLNNILKECKKIRDNLLLEKNLHISELHTIFSKMDFLGVFKCKVSPSKNSYELCSFSPLIISIPGLTSRKIDTFNIPYEKYFTTPSIKSLIFQGWDVKILNDDHNIQFCFDLTLNSFVSCNNIDFCYNEKYIRIFDELKSDEDNSKCSKKIFKLFLNAIPGRLSMKEATLTTLEESNSYNGYNLTLNKSFNKSSKKKSDRFISVFINTNAHLIMTSMIYRLELSQIYKKINIWDRIPRLIYCDTDSLYVNIKDVNENEYDKILYQVMDMFVISDNLGSFNLQKGDYDVTWSNHDLQKSNDASILTVLGKKAYIRMNDKAKILDAIKLKGIPNKDINSVIIKDNILDLDLIDKLLSGEKIYVPINRLQSRTDQNNLKKIFLNKQIEKKIQIPKLYDFSNVDSAKFDFEFKPGIDYFYNTNSRKFRFRRTHSPCNCNNCPICSTWFSKISELNFFDF